MMERCPPESSRININDYGVVIRWAARNLSNIAILIQRRREGEQKVKSIGDRDDLSQEGTAS